MTGFQDVPALPDPSRPPTIGDDVFVTINVALLGDEPKPVTRPAKVVNYFGTPSRCNVVVALDGPNDTHESERRYGAAPTTKWLGAVVYDPTGATAPSWRWLAK